MTALTSLLLTTLLTTVAADDAAPQNPVFRELIEKGVVMSDGSAVPLPPPILADGLTADEQQATLKKLCDARTPLEDVLSKASSAPVVIKIRTIKAGKDESPSIRSIDFWFIAHGDWEVLNSKDFLDSLAQRDDDAKSRVVSKAGVLTDDEQAKRQLTVSNDGGLEQRFVYTTFSLFDRVEISATRSSMILRQSDSILAAGKIDPAFTEDPDYPNQWRELLRDEKAEIQLGPPHAYAQAGGYAKITRLLQPAGAVLIECHLVYEEPYGWFEGANLVKQKVPLMVQEKARTFRRKLALANEKQ
jgi:hypothetical protein